MNKCLFCGKDTKNIKYCNMECYGKASTKTVIHNCKMCGKETANKVYCGQICHNKGQTVIEENSCKICGKKTKNNKYCSQKCVGSAFSVKYKGEKNPHYGKKNSKSTRKKIFIFINWRFCVFRI